jgi:trehalose 6-phosphate synthase/phosphatase
VRLCAGRFGTLTHVPIHHLDRKLTFKELCALYAITDVALVTSLRDGMNLVSYEFVACQAENAGVLVLSEFAGAAQSLGAGSILVNPWNVDDMTAALREAVRMLPETRRRLWRSNYQHVSVHTAQTWGDHFIMELNETCATQQQQDARHPPDLPLADVAAASAAAHKRLVVLGYNAALRTVASDMTPRLGYETISANTGRAMSASPPLVLTDLMHVMHALSCNS